MAQEIHFDDHFVRVLDLDQIDSRCNECFLMSPKHPNDQVAPVKLFRCANCHVIRYCSKECQKKAWFEHKTECKILQSQPPGPKSLPAAEILLFIRLCNFASSRKVSDSVEVLKNGKKFQRSFSNFEDHVDDLQGIPAKVAYFNAILQGMELFGSSLASWKIPPTEQLWELFGKKLINSHKITDNLGKPIGSAIDLGLSAYDHSCWPNVAIYNDGAKTVFRSLDPSKNLADTSECFISYIELAVPRNIRRRELASKYFFDCQCVRCIEHSDRLLSAILCPQPGCNKPVVLNDWPCLDGDITCEECQITMSEEARSDIRDRLGKIVDFLNQHEKDTSIDLNLIEGQITEASKFLHLNNVALFDLRDLYFQASLAQKKYLKIGIKYAIESVSTFKMSYPPNFKPIGFHLLKIAYAFILVGERLRAIPYVDKGLTVLENFFGPHHSYTGKMRELKKALTENSEQFEGNELIRFFKFN